MSRLFKILRQISIVKTLRVNFAYLNFREAIKCPILISRQVRLRTVRGKVKFHCPIRPGLVKFGFDTCGLVDYGRDRAVWEVDGTLEFNGSVSLGAATKLIVVDGSLKVGHRVAVTGLTRLIVYDSVSIGDGCLISWDVQIMDTDFHKIYNVEGKRINPTTDVKIGEHVWIGCRCLILKGASIPNNSVVAADSVITKKLEYENVIYGGTPIKVFKSNIIWQE